MMNFSGKNWLLNARNTAAFALVVSLSPAVQAQNTVQQTPPELRDFKLDPVKPKPAPPPLPQPEPQLGEDNTTSNKTLPAPQAKPRQPVAETPRPTLQMPDVTPAPQTRTVPGKTVPGKTVPNKTVPGKSVPDKQLALEPTIAPNIGPNAGPDIAAEAVQEPAAGAIQSSAISEPQSFPQSLPQGWWLIVAAVLAAFAGVLILWRRKKSSNQAINNQEVDEPLAANVAADVPTDIDSVPLPLPKVDPFPIIPVPPVTTPTVPVPASIRGPGRPDIEINFIPEKATLSLAKLTIKGQIRIINNGKVAAKSMQLRAAIISANTHQEQQIAEFHNDNNSAGDAIGSAGVGERIAMDIDLIIPLSELSSFAMNGRQLFAPIVVAHIDYGWDSGLSAQSDVAKISCLIGREATPPKPKMGPLRLDLGPRSFAPLGQRPLFA